VSSTRKQDLYRDLGSRIDGLLAAPSDPIASMATIAAAVHEALPYASWTGFYRVVRPGLLRVGPFQGSVACIDIPFERGVCGAAVSTGETQLVEDVHAFAGHIACDPAARSEIVIPLRDVAGAVFGVLDVDSHEPAAFDAVDREELEKLVGRFEHSLTAT
jgi:GAF domain-containing protein